MTRFLILHLKNNLGEGILSLQGHLILGQCRERSTTTLKVAERGTAGCARDCMFGHHFSQTLPRHICSTPFLSNEHTSMNNHARFLPCPPSSVNCRPYIQSVQLRSSAVKNVMFLNVLWHNSHRQHNSSPSQYSVTCCRCARAAHGKTATVD